MGPLSERSPGTHTFAPEQNFAREMVTSCSHKCENAEKDESYAPQSYAAARLGQRADREAARSESKMGTVKWNCEPCPTSLSAQMRPPGASRRCLALGRP